MTKPKYPSELKHLPRPKVFVNEIEKLSTAEEGSPVKVYRLKIQQAAEYDYVEGIKVHRTAYVIYLDDKRVWIGWTQNDADERLVLLQSIADNRIDRFYIKPKRSAFHIYDRLAPHDVKWISRTVESATHICDKLNQAEKDKWK